MPSFGVSTTSPKNSLSFCMSPTLAIIFIKWRNRHHMKNNIRYKGNNNNTSINIFFLNRKSKTPSNGTLLGRTSEKVFVVVDLHFLFTSLFHFWSSFCCCSSFVDVLHSHLLFDIIPHPSVDYHRVFTPILYFPPSPSQSDLRHFNFQPFRLSSYLLSGRFIPTGVFYLTLPSLTFYLGLYRGLSGSRQLFPWGLQGFILIDPRAHRPGPSVRLIQSNPQLYLERFIFKFYHILTWITCGKKFSLYTPYSFRTLVACSKHICKGY